jgi:transcriptional regulator with XRE-family HTH domain
MGVNYWQRYLAMGFKENLRALRERAGLTQTKAAARVGVPFRSYQNWETGSRQPRLEILGALARAFDVTIDQLVSESPIVPPAQRPRGRRGK